VVAALLLALRVVLVVQDAGRPPAPGATDLSGPDQVTWQPFPAAFAVARATQRPILYDFTAEWCPPCRLLQRQVFSDPGAARQLASHFVPVRVLDRQREEGHNARWVDSLQAVYRVNAFPTLIVTGPDGTGETRRVEGFLGRDATLAQLGASGVSLRFGGPADAPPAGR
jgi:thiol:disulfide interchange protein